MIEGIYVITDERLVPGRTHLEIARAALAGGASAIQLRDKHASDEYLIQAGLQIRELTSAAGALFIVNDRVEVALACGADGIHLGQGDLPAPDLRPLLAGKILGVSVATAEEAARARSDGADYLGVGPIFATSTKTDAGEPVGTRRIRIMRSASSGLPIVAIGGINENNLAQVARDGADAAAVISAVVCADDMVEATRRLVRIWEKARVSGV
ncbi:MAG TPA: thiamine phosphate synthase [Armatimonadota bacterium]|nr:thiamine phosphate synthase [Armatimonadota bacterium]